MVDRMKVGIIGCGNISSNYIKHMQMFQVLDVRAVADIDMERAAAKAAEHGIGRAYTARELLADPEIDIVLNLTVPAVHAEVSLAIIAAGKHVYSEKPLATRREDGKAIMEAAREKGVRVGCAPDTFLGGGLQTSRKLIDDGWIGRPVAAAAFFTGHGPEAWHPNPEFFYKFGAGPMLDLGPYYLTALVNLLGPITRVTGSAQISFPQRLITSQPFYGTQIDVEVPTHVAGVADFASGAVGTIITSFDIWSATLPRIEIYGSEGSISVPDPNIFGGPVLVRRMDSKEWTEMPLSHNASVGRGIGVADMATAIQSGRAHRASGELAYHVLDLMYAFQDASQQEQHVQMQSTVERPAAIPTGLLAGTLDC
jgi:predicted dehydrogenase